MQPAYRSPRALVIGAAFCVAEALLVVCHAQGAPATELPGLGTFFRNADIGDMRLSPSGESIALTVGGATGRVSLAVVDIDNKKPPVVVARFNDADIRSFDWVNDDRLVFNIVDLQSGSGDQGFGPGLYSVRRDGSELRQLIKPSRDFLRGASATRRESLEWNHGLLAVPRDGGDEVVVGERVINSLGELQNVNALRLNVATGRTRSLSLGAPEHATGWLFDPKGEPRVVVSVFHGTEKIFWREPGQDAWALLAEGGSLRMPFQPRFVDGNERLYVSTSIGRAGTQALERFDFGAARPEKEPLITTPGFDFSGRLIEDATGTTTFGVRLTTDAQSTVWFDPGLTKIQAAVDAKLPGRTNVVSCSRCKDPKLVLVHSWSDQDPGTYWIYRPPTDEWQLMGAARRDVDPARMATLDFHRIKARDGMDLPVWVTTPPKRAPKSDGAARPAIVLVHGGPWVRGGQWRWNPETQFLASRGYVVIEPEYRGGLGFGSVHFRAGWKQWEGAMQDDVADSVRWAASQGLIDPKRVCIAGASYGGYATLMGLARYPDLYRCGVAWVAVTDPRLLFQDSWQSDVSEEARKYGLPTLLGDPVKDAAMLRAATPVERAADIRAPLLLAFGRDDRRVPLEHGTLMRDALRAQGRDPEWVVYDGEGHGWLKVENRLDFWSRVERFLDRNLNDAVVPR